MSAAKRAAANKKITIKSFNLRQKAEPVDFKKYWNVLEDSVLRIQRREKTEAMRETLFTAVETLCEQDYAAELYSHVVSLFHAYLVRHLDQHVAACEWSNFNQFLDDLNRFWTEYCQQITMIQNVFTYLNRTYVLQNSNVLTIWDAGLQTFCSVIVSAPRIRGHLFDFVLRLIELERTGNQIDRPLLRSIVRMFMYLRIYEDGFDHQLIAETEKLYKAESRAKIDDLETGAYLRHVSARLKDEKERVNFYLNHNSWERIAACVDRCFIGDYVDVILQKGVDRLLGENRRDDARLLYELFGRVKNARPSLKAAFVAYIKKVGRALITSPDGDKTLVDELIKFKASLNHTIRVCFENNEKFVQGARDAFTFFVNVRANKPAELIAKFMDSKLRLGNKECSEDELDVLMDQVIVLFRFVDGKDYFEAFYKKALSKRLLMGRSASVDAEKAMLAKLKNECGAGFTQKLEGMFKDMEISKELSIAFGTYLNANYTRLAATEFAVSVLTTGNWPTHTATALNVPKQLSDQQEVFEKFYISKHNGRRLQWQSALTSATLKATFASNVRKELDVSMFQAVVLLAFNAKIKHTYEELRTITNIEDVELKRTLQSLACGKFRVINKEPKGRDIATTDSFVFNAAFSNHLFRIKISQVLLRETEAEHRETEEEITQDRQYQIDAAIVRIMKTRKKLMHNMLITELIQQLRFATKPIDLKRRIESLIERDYISRDKEEAHLYNYVA